MLDPLTPTTQLLTTLSARLPAAADRLASVAAKGSLSKLDCLALEENLQAALCAVQGLKQRIEHDKPHSFT